MYIRIWWKNEESKKEMTGIIIGPTTEYALAVRTSTGDIVRVGFGEVDKSEWVTDPTAGVSTKPPRGK
jgi:hypothetical protein